MNPKSLQSPSIASQCTKQSRTWQTPDSWTTVLCRLIKSKQLSKQQRVQLETLCRPTKNSNRGQTRATAKEARAATNSKREVAVERIELIARLPKRFFSHLMSIRPQLLSSASIQEGLPMLQGLCALWTNLPRRDLRSPRSKKRKSRLAWKSAYLLIDRVVPLLKWMHPRWCLTRGKRIAQVRNRKRLQRVGWTKLRSVPRLNWRTYRAKRAIKGLPSWKKCIKSWLR